MAKRNHESGADVARQVRVCKVKVQAGCTFPDYRRVPLIKMPKGLLQRMGFVAGARVDIQASAGCIVLTLRPGEVGDPIPDLAQERELQCPLHERVMRADLLGVIQGLRRR